MSKAITFVESADCSMSIINRVVNWVNAYHEKVKHSAAVPKETPTIEMDELWSFVGEKKTERIS